MKRISRRHFVKAGIALGAAAVASPLLLLRKARHGAWALGSNVHPNIDNRRVVGITDYGMTKFIEPVTTWSSQDKIVNKKVVWENMDKLASELTETRHAKDAWRTIFIKPPNKSWSDTIVAIKTNNVGFQATRSAVMAKICHVLIHTIRIKPHNIHIYDAVHGENMTSYKPFVDLPEGCRIEGPWGGITKPVAVPWPWGEAGGKSECLKHLAVGSVDILINIALCKGHVQRFGKFTMTMKNHFGTFNPKPGHRPGGRDYLMAINQTPEILGPMDKKTGKVLYPRQQLCLIDALWACKGDPGGSTTHQTNFLAMGVFSPIVDYLIATRFRGEKMGWHPNMKLTNRMLSDFGYHEKDLLNEGKIFEV